MRDEETKTRRDSERDKPAWKQEDRESRIIPGSPDWDRSDTAQEDRERRYPPKDKPSKKEG